MTDIDPYKTLLMSKTFKIEYDEFILEVTVQKPDMRHYVKCNYKANGDFRKAYRSIFNFFNEIVWFYQAKLSDVNGGHSQGSHVGLNYTIHNEHYLLDFKQRVFGERQHLGLAFYREAQCNESTYYRFFCFHKILEMPFKDSKGKKEWMVNQLKTLNSDLAIISRDKLSKELKGQSLADWLYKAGRHRITHARLDEKTRDPNNYWDWEEIKWSNVIMQELAEATIVQKLGISSYT